MAVKEYAHPEALVSAERVQEHLDDPDVRIVESDEDVLLYDVDYALNAVNVDWVEYPNYPWCATTAAVGRSRAAPSGAP